MRATIDGPATGSTTELGGWDAVVRHRPRRAGRDPTIPIPRPRLAAPVGPGSAPYSPPARANPIRATVAFQFLSFSISELT